MHANMYTHTWMSEKKKTAKVSFNFSHVGSRESNGGHLAYCQESLLAEPFLWSFKWECLDRVQNWLKDHQRQQRILPSSPEN